MWFYYLLSAIGVSVGTGALVAYDSEQQIAAVIKASEPETHAENTARISRSLRRLHQMNPGAFPTASGNRNARIPAHLLAAATMGGIHLPRDVVFEIDSAGRISSRVASAATMNSDRFDGALDRAGFGFEGTMNRVARNIGLIRNPDPYIYAQEPNLEGVSPGAVVGWSGGGITNPDPGSGGHSSGGSLVSGNPNVVFVPYADSDDENNSSVGKANPDYDGDNGTIGGGGNGGSGEGGSENSNELNSSNAPRAHVDNPEHPKYQAERAFDRACFANTRYTDPELEQLMLKFDAERRTHYRKQISEKYAVKLDAFKQFHLNTRPEMEEIIENRTSGMVLRIAKSVLENHYRENPEWRNLHDISMARTYYSKKQRQEESGAPAHVKEETLAILDAIETSSAYCERLYDKRSAMNNSNIPADGLSSKHKTQLYSKTQALVDQDLRNDPDIQRPVTQTMRNVKRLINGSLDIRDIVRNYKNL